MTASPRITQALHPAEDGTMKRKKKLRWGKTSWCTKPPRKIRYRTKLDAKNAATTSAQCARAGTSPHTDYRTVINSDALSA